MIGITTKQIIVLSRAKEDVYTDVASNSFHGVCFGREGAHCASEDRSESDHITVILPQSVWAEMGEPVEITFTIEPGDKLNV